MAHDMAPRCDAQLGGVVQPHAGENQPRWLGWIQETRKAPAGSNPARFSSAKPPQKKPNNGPQATTMNNGLFGL